MVDRLATNSDAPARYVVGIDLGTTNSAVCYVDTHESPWRVQTLAVPQLVAPGVVEARETLPSFHYEPAPGELAADALALPWKSSERNYAVGFFARDHGALVPGRLVASAKSWLSHSGVDRTAELLPWHGAEDVTRISPVEATARYLRHVHEAFNHQFPHEPLAEQDVVLTLPASFDEVARELTVQAAALAELPRVVLIEEPQAAFYAWINSHSDDWEGLVSPGQKILVCDIGGGTSDFTLIRVRAGEGGKVQFHRVAVGEHLILGGDNLDLALAHHLERKLFDATAGQVSSGTGRLQPRQWSVLVRTCRQVKEALLGPNPPESYTVNLPGAGAKLLGGSLQVVIGRVEAREVLVDGFLPRVPLTEVPQTRRSGFQEFGLPFAPDAAITRYLAAFLTTHRHVGEALDDASGSQSQRGDVDPARPDIVLFNGGFFESAALRKRLLEVLTSWFQPDDRASSAWSPIVLDAQRLDLAVARGAAYYGMVRRGQGVRIAASLARTYYIGVEGIEDRGQGEGTRIEDRGARDEGRASDSPLTTHSLTHQTTRPPDDQTTGHSPPQQSSPVAVPLAVCLVPASIEPGQDVDLSSRRFDLVVSQPVEFPLYISSTRLTDPPGAIVAFDREQMTPLPPIRTVLKTRGRSDTATVPVELHARLTEIGTLDLWCGEQQGPRRWRLQFDVRSATETDVAAHSGAAEVGGFVDEATWEQCQTILAATFGSQPTIKPRDVMRKLGEAIGSDRWRWPTSLLRRIWESLLELETARRRSEAHESRWLNLLGFALRPGYGLAVDDWRVTQTWRLLHGKLYHAAPACVAESRILWRRIAGGLAAGQQQALADPLVGPIRGLFRQLSGGKKAGGDVRFTSQESIEVWRLLGSLELLDVRTKVELGEMLVALAGKKKMEPVRPAVAWALGRIGARVPLYGPLNTVVPAEHVAQWLRELVDAFSTDPMEQLAVMQMARRTDDRYRDLKDSARNEVWQWLQSHDAPDHYVELVRQGGTLAAEEQDRIFGEALPVGLRVAS